VRTCSSRNASTSLANATVMRNACSDDALRQSRRAAQSLVQISPRRPLPGCLSANVKLDWFEATSYQFWRSFM
jgi:hypothetical protein